MSLSFFKDKAFFRAMLALAVPVAFQQLITAGLNMIDVLMVGQLGEASVAALGLANQIFFLLILFLFGVSSGTAIFTAQYWGKGDTENIRKVLGICLAIAVSVAVLFTLAATLIPEKLMGFYTEDPEVIKLGSEYLRIVGLSYVLMAISVSYISILRSITLVKVTVIVSVLALALKTLIGYSLIFGHFGLPALGVRGAAIGTATGWVFESIALLILVHALKTPLAGNPLTFFQFDRAFLFNVLRTSMPAAINEVIWSFGITTYNAVYARIGTDSIAAININATMEELVFVLFIGLGNACSVMVGNKIGEKEKETAFEYSRRFTILAVMLALLGGAIVFLLRDIVGGLYPLSPSALFNLRNIMLVYALSSWLRVFNFILFIGALRAGGDTKYAMYMELFSIWFIGVPAALIGGFVLQLPVYYVYALVLLEEAVKAIVIFRRFISRKWIHDLVNVTWMNHPLLFQRPKLPLDSSNYSTLTMSSYFFKIKYQYSCYTHIMKQLILYFVFFCLQHVRLIHPFLPSSLHFLQQRRQPQCRRSDFLHWAIRIPSVKWSLKRTVGPINSRNCSKVRIFMPM